MFVLPDGLRYGVLDNSFGDHVGLRAGEVMMLPGGLGFGDTVLSLVLGVLPTDTRRILAGRGTSRVTSFRMLNFRTPGVCTGSANATSESSELSFNICFPKLAASLSDDEVETIELDRLVFSIA